MIDLTNENHKRGVMILTSKDVRVVDSSLFDWQVHTGCIESYLDSLKHKVNRFIDPSVKEDVLQDIEFCMNWVKKSQADIDKAREVFR